MSPSEELNILRNKVLELQEENASLKHLAKRVKKLNKKLKKREKILFEAQQRLQLILDNIPQRIFWKDTKLNYMGCNKPFARDAGCKSTDDIIEKSDYDLAFKANADAYRKDDSDVIREGKPRINYIEPQETDERDQIRWLETSKIPLYNINKKIIGVLGLYEDITQQIEDKKQIQQQNEEIQAQNEEFVSINEKLRKNVILLAESEEKFRIITEQSLSGIGILAEFQLKYVNQKFAKILGYPEQDIYAWKEKEFLKAVHPEDRALVIEQANLKTNRNPAYKKNYAFRIQKKNGEMRWVELWSKPITYENQNAILITLLDIHEQHQAIDKVKQSEAYLNAILKAMPSILLIIDYHGNYRNAFTAQHQLLAAPPEKLINSNIYDYLDKKGGDVILSKLRKAIDSDELQYMEYPIQIKGEQKWFTAQITSIDWEGKTHALLVAIDITQRLIEQEKLARSEAEIKAILDNLPHLAWLKDKNGKYLRINESFSEVFNIKNKDLVGKEHEDVLSDYIASPMLPDQDILTTGKRMFLEQKLMINNETRWFETFKSPVRNNRNEITGITGVSREITQRKNYEARLLLFQQLVENSIQGMAISDKSGNFIFLNKILHNFLNVPDKKSLNSTKMKDYLADDTVRFLEEVVNPTLHKEKKWTGELEFKTKSGKAIQSLHNIMFISDEKNDLEYYASIITDIGEQKKAQEELRKAKNKAEESDRLKSAFLANMSHEIRTPMNGILGFSNLLEDEDIDDLQRKEYIKIINQNSESLLNLIDDIIDIAKIEAGQLKINKTQASLNDIISDLYQLFEKIIQRKGLDLEFKYKLATQENIEIFTDPYRLKQIISNLISNAIKFTDKGSIEFGYQFKKDRIEFFVKDTGIGMTLEKASIIFERFRQIDASLTRNHGGTGLGLAISKHLVNLLEGTIRVESEKNKGSTFYFDLPYRTETYQKDSSPEIKLPPETNKIPNWDGKKVLIAEDEEINFYYIKEVLAKTHIQILHARDGIQALELFRENESLDLIIMDIKMPNMDGYEATRKIRKENTDIPIIAVTAYAMEDDRQKALDVGCDAYLSKPVSKIKLFEIVKKYIPQKST